MTKKPEAAGKSKLWGQLQVEMTSRCNLRCRTCLYSRFEDQWVPQEMDAEVFAALLEVAPQAEGIHLQGWGESLLRNDLPESVAAVKAAGSTPTLSTNGTIMTSALAKALIDAGIGSMTFSLAGPDRRSQELLRGAGTFSKATAGIRCFHRQRSGQSPALMVNYLLTPHNIKHLPRALALCARLGVDTLVATHLSHDVTATQSRLSVYGRERPYGRALARSRLAVLWRRVKLILPHTKGDPLPICPKDPTRNAFVAADGAVSPCVYLCPPLDPHGLERPTGGRRRLRRVVMGNLTREPFETIWERPAYREFRAAFARRKTLYDKHLPPMRTDFDGLERLGDAVTLLKRRFREPAHQPPEVCSDCPHLWGY